MWARVIDFGIFRLFTTVVAAAAPSGALPIDLGWEGPASCPPSEDIDRDVRRILGDTTLPEALPPIAAKVSVRENTDGRFEVRMVTTSSGETRERALHTETCDEARELVAFLLALLIDPNARAPSPAPATSETLPPKPAPPAPVEPAPVSRKSPAAERADRWVLGLSGSAEYGTLPGGSLGGEVRGGLLLSGWSIEARASAWVPRRAESPDVPEAGGKFSLFDAALLGCLRGRPSARPAVQGCIGPGLLWLRGEGYGVTMPSSDEALIAAVAAEAALLVAVSRQVSLRPALGALVPLVRPTFAIHDVGTIHRPNAVAFRVSLGFEARFR